MSYQGNENLLNLLYVFTNFQKVGWFLNFFLAQKKVNYYLYLKKFQHDAFLKIMTSYADIGKIWYI